MPGAPVRSRAVAVFMYHDLEDDPGAIAASHRPYVLTPGAFEEQMDALVRLGIRGVGLSEALAGVDSSAGAGGRPVAVLTFDDGHASNATRAVPILRARGFTATFFVTAGWIGQPPYMDRAQIRAVAEAGMEIGTHSLTHRPPAALSPAELDHELRESRRILEEGIGRPVLTGSAPTGFHNPAIGPAARAAGYRALCVGRIALWTPGGDPFSIPRVPVKAGMPLEQFTRLVRGEAGPLRGLRARQVVRNALKRGLGIGPYLRLRRALLGFKGRSG
jgi:peptidoglycan/xylan/chitin deacetylase (PgdA/CDA1 family)